MDSSGLRIHCWNPRFMSAYSDLSEGLVQVGLSGVSEKLRGVWAVLGYSWAGVTGRGGG